MVKELKMNLNEFKNICNKFSVKIPNLCKYFVRDKPVFYLTVIINGRIFATKNFKDFDKLSKWASKNFISYNYY